VVKANGLNILEFLKRSCVREGGTYWIFKDTETNQVQLYDISSEEEGEEGPERAGEDENEANKRDEGVK
jgi:hypothetical protein